MMARVKICTVQCRRTEELGIRGGNAYKKDARERRRGRLRRLAMHWAYVGQMTSSSEAARPPGSTPSLEAAWDGPTGPWARLKSKRVATGRPTESSPSSIGWSAQKNPHEKLELTLLALIDGPRPPFPKSIHHPYYPHWATLRYVTSKYPSIFDGTCQLPRISRMPRPAGCLA